MLHDERHNSRMSTQRELVESVRFNDDGLVPVIAQQWDSREVLMMAWMDLPALERTLATGEATYFSRSRGEQWVKGATSGHRQQVRTVMADCDGDTLLILVDQLGSACHTGDRTCFDAMTVDLEGDR